MMTHSSVQSLVSQFTSRRRNRLPRQTGVALILVLGLLSVLTMLAVAFSISMRVERVASRNYANDIRAREMTSVALTRAVEKISSIMFTNCYPHWENEPSGVRDAMASEQWPAGSSNKASSILTAEVNDLIPGTLRADLTAAAKDCYWHKITGAGGTNIGQVAYMIVNASGLIDANLVGGAPQRIASTNINELDVSILSEFSGNTNNAITFKNERLQHRRYETIMELATMNSGIAGTSSNGVVSNFFTYSYDPGRDMMYTNKELIGQRYVQLMPKFSINHITNWAGFVDEDPGKYRAANSNGIFAFTNYFSNLMFYVEGKGSFISTNGILRAPDVCNGILNYIDADHIPQTTEDDRGYYHSECVEAVPLINEIVCDIVTNNTLGASQYVFSVELWYPFVPNSVTSGQYNLQVMIFTNDINSMPAASKPPPEDIFSAASTDFSFTLPVPAMKFGTMNEFVVISSPTNNYLRFYGSNSVVLGGVGDGGKLNRVWFLARVIERASGSTVDEAMGYDPYWGGRNLMEFTNQMGYSVNDPRSNGQVQYWTTVGGGGVGEGLGLGGTNYLLPAEAFKKTLGSMNTNCQPWGRKGQGVPIFLPDRPMRNIGEIGHIYQGNLNGRVPDREDYFWQSVNILSYNYGAFLLDRLTVRPTNDVEKSSIGLISIGTAQTNVLRALFNNMHIGETNQGGGVTVLGDDPPVNALIDCLITNGPYWTFQEMFTDDWYGGPLGNAFRNLAPTVHQTNDIMREDGLRNIVDLITFRQNIYQIVLAAQVFGLDGQTVVAEKRALATVYRDSYQGEFFIRSFQWLQED